MVLSCLENEFPLTEISFRVRKLLVFESSGQIVSQVAR